MLKRIKSFLTGDAAPAADDNEDELAAATVAILVETAQLDGDFDAHERETIHAILVDRFGLSGDDADELVEAALSGGDGGANGVYAATRLIRDNYSEEERIDILEMLWRVAYADGTLHDYEANLVRRVAGLLYVQDRDSGIARKRAMQDLGLDEAK